MRYIVTPAQAKAIDHDMIEGQGIPGLVLMERAASGVTGLVRRLLPEGGRTLILCGRGNNGGDGLAVLRQLTSYGIKAEALLLCSCEKLQGDAKKQYQMAAALGLSIREVTTPEEAANVAFHQYAMVVDALFGTGLQRDVQGTAAELIRRLNESERLVAAVDIPSGVDGATGRVMGIAVRAAYTVTFQYAKPGHLFYPGKACTGELTVIPIGSYEGPLLEMEQLEQGDLPTLLPKRDPGSHKGSHGRALLMAGSADYTGAAVLAATAAVRGGAGLTHAAVPKELRYAMTSVPAVICHLCGQGSQWDMAAALEGEKLFQQADVLALGPGCGAGEGVIPLVEAAIATHKPLVLDADGLNGLSRERLLLERLHQNVILTPHPGEMARLTGLDTADITADPIAAAKGAAKKWGCTVLLKGAVSVIAGAEGITLNATGNAGLAKGGSGDVLTGLILALLAQGLTPYDAARTGAYLLGLSADKALEILQNRMLSPMDVTEAIQSLIGQEPQE